MCECKELKNTHNTRRNITLEIWRKENDTGFVLMENNLCIASFDGDYCPTCGEELKEGVK